MKLFLLVLFCVDLYVGILHKNDQEVTYNIPKDRPTMPIELDTPVSYNVTVTVYHAVPEQTDSTPHIMASGVQIDLEKAHEYRYCALSRDLLKRWGGPFDFGDVVKIEGTSHDGYWIVQDTMNARFKNRVDLLVHEDIRYGKYKGILVVANMAGD